MTIRLRVENRALTEAEWYIARENDPGLSGPRQPGRPPANLHNPEYLELHPPRQERRAGQSSVWIVRRWAASSTATSMRSPRMTVRSRSRTRVVAARRTARPAPGGAFLPPDTARAASPLRRRLRPRVGRARSRTARAAATASAGLENFNAAMVAARRMPLIDEEAQMVLATGVFIRKPGSPTPRNVASWWFVIDEAKIRTTYTAMFYPPAGLAVPNWPPYDGNWPLPETTVPAPARVP